MLAVKTNLYSVKIMIYKAKMARKPNTVRARVRRAANNVAPARVGRKRSAPRTAGSNEDAPYHHGALHDALLEAAERVLERDGPSGLTRRAGARGAGGHEQISEEALSLEQAAAIARAWSLVHGFTMLLLDDRLSDILRRLPKGTDAETLLDAMLKSTVGRPPGA